MEGLRLMLGDGPQLAYLSYMANRLVGCHRVLKPTGSVYLHCDPTMSHYLKTVMDALFGRGNFRNEIVWHYDGPQRPSRRNFGTKHDILLRYSKTDSYKVNALEIIPSQELTASELASYKRRVDGRYYYDLPPGDYTEASIERLRTEGRIRTTADGKIRVMYFLDTDDHGNHYRAKQRHDVWDDIPSVGQAGGKQSLGYPTQKPLALFERIIKASSSEGDLIMDPFCGCGTAIHAAQNLGRRWMGIDICVNACKVIERRIKSHFDSLWSDVEFRGLPKTRDDVRFMAGSDPFRFERWAASLVDGMEANKKQHGDHGIDGWGRLPIKKGQFIDLVSQVKGGHTNPGHVQAFNGARQQAGTDLGIFTCFKDRVTTGMLNAAVNTGKFMNAPVV